MSYESKNGVIVGLVTTDGSVPLTGNWDIGDGNVISADQIAARDGDGLLLSDDGGNGVFVEDGGQVGIGTVTPNVVLRVESEMDGTDGITVVNNSTGNSAASRLWLTTLGKGDSHILLTVNPSSLTYWSLGVDSDASASFKLAKALSLGTASDVLTMDVSGNMGLGLTPTANMAGLSVEAGIVTVKETTTPTADTNYGKIYCKADNKLYFQDGAGDEHEITLAT